MALSHQNFVKGEDLTVLDPINATDVNNLVDLATLKTDTNGDGKGIILLTVDQTLDTPTVPDAASFVSWKKYLWIRIPHATATVVTPKTYAWNPAQPNDATYLRWVETTADISNFQAQIDAVVADTATALINAATALVAANAANATASTALTTATDAETDAISAASAAASASASAVAAQTTATNALAVANAAAITAAAKHDITAALNPGTAGQKIRTNSDASAVEWFDDVKMYAKVSYSPAKNTAPEASANATWIHRKVTVEDADVGNLVTLAGDIITFAVPGIYRVHIVAPAIRTQNHKAVLIDNDTNLMKLAGSGSASNSGVGSVSIITGIITVTAVIKNFAIYHYTEVAGGKLCGSETAINIAYPNAGIDLLETYLTCEFWKIN